MENRSQAHLEEWRKRFLLRRLHHYALFQWNEESKPGIEWQRAHRGLESSVLIYKLKLINRQSDSSDFRPEVHGTSFRQNQRTKRNLMISDFFSSFCYVLIILDSGEYSLPYKLLEKHLRSLSEAVSFRTCSLPLRPGRIHHCHDLGRIYGSSG